MRVRDALPRKFKADACAKPGAAGLKARIDCLERLKLRAPKLSFAKEVRWEEVRDEYAGHCPKLFDWAGPGAVGINFIKRINKCLRELGVHFGGTSEWNKPGMKGGKKNAFDSPFDEMEHLIPKAGVVAEF